MSKLKLWGHTKSINVQKALWALDELGLDYERIDVGGSFGKTKEPEYLALNPNGLIPTLQDGDVTVWESNAVVRYLFDRYGKAPLQPDDPGLRASADSFTAWYSSTLWPVVRTLREQLVRTPEEKRDAGAIEASVQKLKSALAVLEGQLARTPFIAGAHFTWGDIPVGAAAQRVFSFPLQKLDFPAVHAWYGRLSERPAFEKWVAS